jgi:hypothetical protein
MPSPFRFLSELGSLPAQVRSLQRTLEGNRVLQGMLLHRQALATDPRYADPRHLARFGRKSFSQNDEDGIIAEIFRRVGTETRYFVEFGVGPASENNTLQLLLEGWTGAWIEKSEKSLARIRERLAVPLERKELALLDAFILAETIEDLFQQAGVPEEPDFLSIDIDGNDYWVWKAITHYRPRVVCIEYRASLGPSADRMMQYNPKHVWARGSKNFGASAKAYERLGREKGYALVACNFNGTNAFLVRDDLVDEDCFLGPFTSEQHWEPKKPVAFHPRRTPDQDDVSAFFW